MFLCDCMCLMHLCSCLHLISISLSSVYFHEWMRDAERHRAQRHIRGDSSPAPFHSPAPLFLLSLSSSFPPLCCSAEPALLPYLPPPLLPKPGCTLRPLCLSVFSLSLFFSLMSTELGSQCFMPPSHTPHLQNHKKGKERMERRITKQDGDSSSNALPRSSSSSRLGIKKNTFSKVSPPRHTPISHNDAKI